MKLLKGIKFVQNQSYFKNFLIKIKFRICTLTENVFENTIKFD